MLRLQDFPYRCPKGSMNRLWEKLEQAEMSEIATIQPAVARKPGLVARMAERFGVDADKMLSTLKATAFKSGSGVSNEQMMALLIVAEQHGLNPWTKEIYAFPDRQNGIVPVVGVDGWARIINSHEQFDGMDFQQDDESCACTIYRKDRAHPIRVTEWMAECRRENVGPWKSHPKRMLRHKAMIQCARLAFGFTGIYDQDEAERIVQPEVSTAKVRAQAAQAILTQPAEDAEFAETVDTTTGEIIAAEGAA